MINWFRNLKVAQKLMLISIFFVSVTRSASIGRDHKCHKVCRYDIYDWVGNWQ